MTAPVCLLADPSKVVRLITSRSLQEMGFAVTPVDDLQKLCTIADSTAPQLIIMEWQAEGFDGLACLQRLRQSLPNSKIVLCSTTTSIAAMQQALEAGVDEYIMKPFDHTILRSKLELAQVL